LSAPIGQNLVAGNRHKSFCSISLWKTDVPPFRSSRAPADEFRQKTVEFLLPGFSYGPENDSATADSLQAIAAATGGAASDPLANPLGGYGSNTAGGVLQNLGKVNVTIVSPITNNGLIKIMQGDDYKATDNRAIPFPLPVAQWGDLTNATVAFVAVRAGSRIGPLAGTIVNGNSSAQAAQVELAAADTSGIRASDNQNDTYEYAVRVLKAADEITVFRGPLLLERNLFV
jgi:hypothetical protein